MAVYVDDMRAAFGRMIMCHMIADTTEELLSMADKIGVNRKWIQYPNGPREHFDIALSKRALAVKNGAIEVDMRTLAMMERRRIGEGKLGKPDEAPDWYNKFLRDRGI